MSDVAGRIVKIIITDKDALISLAYPPKSRHLPLVCLLLCHTVCYLYVVPFIPALSQEIDLPAVVVIYGNPVSHIDQLIVYDILKVMCQIISVVPAPDRI